MPGPGLIALCAVIASLVAAAVSAAALRAPAVLAAVTPRSSHTRPTPRTGGLAVAAGFLLAVALVAFATPDLRPDLGAVATLAAAVCAFGLVDDVMSAPPATKLALQVLFAGLAAYGLAAFPALPLPLGGEIALGPFGLLLTLLWIAAFMNVFNFMDGLNGMAAGAAVVGGAALAIAALAAGAPAAATLYVAVAAAAAGFAPFNVAGGRIFLGDNGSQTIGFLLAAGAPLAARESGGAFNAAFAPIVFAPFLFDVFWTLATRARRRAPLAEAHKEHLYQRLHQAGASHGAVAGLFALMIGVCAAIAFFAAGAEAWWAGVIASGIVFAAALRIAFAAVRRPAPAE
ncbi:MAG: glycosyl transferase [Pseudomonadota bacterium]